jgi:hypothetical protein
MEFNCEECGKFWATNVNEMTAHVLMAHPNYTPEEAAKFAQIWLDDAIDTRDVEGINWDGN